MHNHTYRCKHAVGDEEEMIKQAISDGFEVVGISDHIAYPISATMFRMEYEEKDEYLSLLDKYRLKYQDKIKVYRGFEAEYEERFKEYIVDMYLNDRIDYLALGQHYYDVEKPETYHGNISVPSDLYLYVDQCIDAMKSGLFLFFAHPDLCFNYIYNFD